MAAAFEQAVASRYSAEAVARWFEDKGLEDVTGQVIRNHRNRKCRSCRTS
jgi:hypothetical protein